MESFTKRANSGRGASSCEQVADSMSRKKKKIKQIAHPPPLKHPASFLVIYSAVYIVYIKES